MAVSPQNPRNGTGKAPVVRTGRSASAPPPASPSASTPPSRQREPRRGWIAAVLLGLVVLVAVGVTVPPGAPLHQVWAATADALAQRQADPQVAALQAVIQRANNE